MTGFCKGSCWFPSLSFQTLCMRIISNTEKHPFWNKHHVEPTYVFWDSSVYFLKVCIAEQRYLLWVFWSHIPNQHWLWLLKEGGRGEDWPPLSPLFKSCPLVAHAQFSNNKPTWQWPHYSCCLPLTLLMTIQGSHRGNTSHSPGRSARTCGKQAATFSASKNYSRKTVLEQTLSCDRKLPHWHNNARDTVSHQQFTIWGCSLSTKGCTDFQAKTVVTEHSMHALLTLEEFRPCRAHITLATTAVLAWEPGI